MKVKRCTQCGHAKPLADYYRHSAMRDGRTSACKACTKAYVAVNFGVATNHAVGESPIPDDPVEYAERCVAMQRVLDRIDPEHFGHTPRVVIPGSPGSVPMIVERRAEGRAA